MIQRARARNAQLLEIPLEAVERNKLASISKTSFKMTPKLSWKEWLRCLVEAGLALLWQQVKLLLIFNQFIEYFDPFNQKMEFGWNCDYKSRWDFFLNNKGRMSTRRFLKERKVFQSLPYPLKHSLFHPDDIKKLRDKPFSGLFFHFDK